MKKTAAKEETKQALIQAFWKLYREKRIEKITVGEIAAVAGYNRSTFYEYFYDVPDVLQQIEDGILDEMQFGIPGDRIPLEEVVALFERNADALSVLLGEHGDFSFFFRVRGKMRDAFHALAAENGVTVDSQAPPPPCSSGSASPTALPRKPTSPPCTPSTAPPRNASSQNCGNNTLSRRF